MASWQSYMLTTMFRARRFFHPLAAVLDVQAGRAETEALAANFKIRPEVICTPVLVEDLPAEWITPPGSSAERLLVYFHGGSYNSGSINSHRSLVANIAASAKSRALTIDYRLAPEHPFPMALEDALTAYRWLLNNQLSPDQIVVAGDSSGGGLTLSLLISLREANEPLPAMAVCLSPWTDLTCTGETWETNAKHDIMLDRGTLKQSAELYLGEADPRNPLASPLHADLRGLPPLLIQVGSEEILLSDSTCFAERARNAGVDVTLEVWEGMQHEWHFAAQVLPEARQAIDHIGRFIETRLGSAPS